MAATSTEINELLTLITDLRETILAQHKEIEDQRAELVNIKNEVRILNVDLQNHTQLYNGHIRNLHM